MTPEEMQAELQTLKEGNEALASKNRELLGELKAAKAKAKGAEIDPEEHARLQNELEETQAQLKKLSKTAQSETEKLTQQLEQAQGALQSHLIDGGLTDALAKAKVKPELMDAAKALLRGQAAVQENQALIGDKPLADAVNEWATGEQGKHFVLADENAGGGAQGGGGAPATPKGNLGGDKTQRTNAIKQRFPELSNAS